MSNGIPVSGALADVKDVFARIDSLLEQCG